MNKIVIGLTVRGKDADKFWFSLFHELGHIILGHINKTEGLDADDEKAADGFARNQLIPDELFNGFTVQNNFSRVAIISFAKKVAIHAGIVVGRLQKENFISFKMHNNLKQRYELT